MNYWSQAETEFFINITTDKPNQFSVGTNWAFYIKRLMDCEAFDLVKDYQPAQGGREVRGYVDQSGYSYIYLRRTLSEAQEAEFQQEKAKLPPLVEEQTEYKAGVGERETVIHVEKDSSYWMRIGTDMAVWIRQLEVHPYAVLIKEQLYSNVEVDSDGNEIPNEEGGDFSNRHRTYLMPRHLLSIRKARRKLTEAQKQVLRDRIGIS